MTVQPKFEQRSVSAKKAWATRRTASYKASRSEKASKVALQKWCRANGWKILFFEGESGAPRTGIVDAIIARISSFDADSIDIRFVQLKSGSSGLSAKETLRIKQATEKVSLDWIAALYDGNVIHFLPDMPLTKKGAP
jgi:hypothetical protein